MMSQTTAAAIEKIKRNLRSLRALADELEARLLWQEAQSIHADADCIAEAVEQMELDAEAECEDHSALDRAA